MWSVLGSWTLTMMNTCWNCDRTDVMSKGKLPGSWNTTVTMSLPMCLFLSNYNVKRIETVKKNLNSYWRVDNCTYIYCYNYQTDLFSCSGVYNIHVHVPVPVCIIRYKATHTVVREISLVKLEIPVVGCSRRVVELTRGTWSRTPGTSCNSCTYQWCQLNWNPVK